MIHNRFLFFQVCCLMLFLPVTFQAQQITVSSGKGVVYQQYDNNIDWLVMMYDVDLNAEISIVLPDPALDVAWYRFPDQQFISNQQFISPEDHTGYLVQISGTLGGQAYSEEMSIWVIDYKKYLPVLNSLNPEPNQGGNCQQLEISWDGNIPDMYYQTPAGLTYMLDRYFRLSYETLAWNDEWLVSEVVDTVQLENQFVLLNDPPLKDTYFKLSGDQFLTDLQLDDIAVESSLFDAVKVMCHIQTETEIRTEKNEGDRPESITTIAGSAPLEILFTANANKPVADFYQWDIYSDGELYVSRNDENHRFTFTNAGTYLVKLRAENAYCHHVDSVVIKVSESALYAPNIFTPNGDGINDEFRVAYKSIIEFECWVYNRWGTRVYHWSDPQKGWDGTIQGKPANEGAYFYVIKALGADGIDYHLRGDINLLRGQN